MRAESHCSHRLSQTAKRSSVPAPAARGTSHFRCSGPTGTLATSDPCARSSGECDHYGGDQLADDRREAAVAFIPRIVHAEILIVERARRHVVVGVGAADDEQARDRRRRFNRVA
jgi:hypothetical protein